MFYDVEIHQWSWYLDLALGNLSQWFNHEDDGATALEADDSLQAEAERSAEPKSEYVS